MHLKVSHFVIGTETDLLFQLSHNNMTLLEALVPKLAASTF
jgi:hypothetical protein